MGRAKWTGLFLRRNLKANLAKDLACFFAALLGNASLLLSIGYFSGYEAAIEDQSHLAPDYGLFRVSEKKRVSAGDSPLQLVETRRPYLETCLDAVGESDIQWGLDFSRFFPEAVNLQLTEEEKLTAKMVPVYSFLSLPSWKPKVLSGEWPREDSIGFCAVNRRFAEEFSKNNAPGDVEFIVHTEAKIDGAMQEEERTFRFSITCVIEDFSFLSAPKIYYSYLGLESLFVGTLFGETGKSVFQLVKEAEPNSPLSNYSRLAFCYCESDVAKAVEISKKQSTGLSFSGEMQQMVTSFRMLNQSFSSSLALFSALSILGVCLILGMSNYSNFIAQKKENAELLALGAKKKDIFGIYFSEAFALCALSAALAFLLAPPINSLANLFFETKFGIAGIIAIPLLKFQGIPMLLEVVFLVLAFAISLLSSFPLLRAKGRELLEELRDE